MLKLLKRAHADTKTLLSVYVTCIRPVVEYGVQVWHYNLPNYLCVELERIQLRAMRIIDSSVSYTNVLIKYNLLNLLCTSFFGKNVLQQLDILSELVQYEHNFNYDLRYQNNLIPYRCRTNQFKNSYIPSSIGIFNENCQL
jgi:hypothetical protein